MKLPFKIMLSAPASKHALETVTNPYSGQSCQLPRYAVAVYDTIKGAEVTGDMDLMRKGLDWFQKNFTDQYYVLLDQKKQIQRGRTSNGPGAFDPRGLAQGQWL